MTQQLIQKENNIDLSPSRDFSTLFLLPISYQIAILVHVNTGFTGPLAHLQDLWLSVMIFFP